jgi:adenylosuccinate synthase
VNAGHTVYFMGKAYAMQQIPVSWVRPQTMLVLGPGAYIHPTILKRELDWITEAQPMHNGLRVYIDHRCGIHTEHHTELARNANRHHLMGATGKGCSEAVVHKIKSRGGIPATFAEWLEENPEYKDERFCITDTVKLVNDRYDRGELLLIEGTQGTLLDLHLGPYPYTTHKQTQAASWLAEAGLSANVIKEIWGVYRTFPIRVAGNSGPMPGEISWVRFSKMLNSRYSEFDLPIHTGTGFTPPLIQPWALDEWNVTFNTVVSDNYPELMGAGDPATWPADRRSQFKEAASELHRLTLERASEHLRTHLLRLWEVTTVTKKLRRIARWDTEMFEESIMLNRPDFLALTFMNYEFPHLWGVTDTTTMHPVDVSVVASYMKSREKSAGCPVGLISFGPDIAHTHMTGRTWEDMHHDRRSSSRV